MINLGIELTTILKANPAGISRYALNIAKHAVDHPEISLTGLFKASRYKSRQFVPSFISQKTWYYGKVLPLKKNYDVIHATDSKFPEWKRPVKVITIHDLAIFKPEHQFEAYSPEKFRERGWQKVNHFISYADFVITPSQSTKNDVVDLLGFPEHKIFVTHLGADLPVKEVKGEIESLTHLGLTSKKYLLFTGLISTRKNLINLIDAYKLSGIYNNYELVLCGSPGNGYEEIVQHIANTNMGNYIKLTGFVPDDALYTLYKQAAAFVFPTYYEGFGIPVLEAMQMGLPVLAGNKGAVPELAAGHAVLADPFSVENISEGLQQVIKLKPENVEMARQHALSFSWEKCALKTIEIYKTISGKL